MAPTRQIVQTSQKFLPLCPWILCRRAHAAVVGEPVAPRVSGVRGMAGSPAAHAEAKATNTIPWWAISIASHVICVVVAESYIVQSATVRATGCVSPVWEPVKNDINL